MIMFTAGFMAGAALGVMLTCICMICKEDRRER